ncbi:uncharacterized protein LOC112570319 [Pomacea canaliculata]|uniref:uncharacterized protein LOC112570319 n=1 Tax=Pomacea canaliculata TaxID=400727 RepID=UPI000D737142|nr:uncharacterized protein LOC112570319 [Pomacea canaliculata]
MNRYQCERLCWYRKLCKTYSYIYNRTLASDVVYEQLQDNGCCARHCKETEVCVPTYDSPFYKCLPFSAECQAPPQVDGTYDSDRLVQGQRTNFTCNSSLLWIPRHADKTVTCQVTGKYSGLKGTCENTTHYSPSIPFNKPLPDLTAKEWEACFKGIFIGTQRMTFNFHDRQDASCDFNPNNYGNIYLSLDFRHNFVVTQEVMWATGLNNCSWSPHSIGPLLLQPSNYFEITLRILFNNTMQIIYKDHPTQQLDLVSNHINLTKVTYLEILNHVKLFYVNVIKGCDWLYK